jgi:hypothetical protein
VKCNVRLQFGIHVLTSDGESWLVLFASACRSRLLFGLLWPNGKFVEFRL